MKIQRILKQAAIVAVCAACLQPAVAMTVSSRFDVANPTIDVVDLTPQDGVAPSFRYTPEQSSVVLLQYGGGWFPQWEPDWDAPLAVSFASVPAGATGTSTWSGQGRVAESSLDGFAPGDHVVAANFLQAGFVLGQGSQVSFRFSGHLTLSGADPYDPSHEVYANLQAMFMDLTPGNEYVVLDHDYLRLESWLGDGDVSRDLAITISNTGSTDLIGWLRIEAQLDAISHEQPPAIPEPATGWLTLIALAGLGARRRLRAARLQATRRASGR